jgi:carbonic anhydrase
MNKLITIRSKEEIPSAYRDTPIGRLLEYHNLNVTFNEHHTADLIIGTCIDYRVNLHIPDNFAYIIRAGGGNLAYNEFKISFIVSMKGIKHLAVIGHTDCGMVNLESRKEQFIDGLVENAGWEKGKARDHFHNLAPESEIGNEMNFTVNETSRMRQLYPELTVVPMLYKIEDQHIYLINEFPDQN